MVNGAGCSNLRDFVKEHRDEFYVDGCFDWDVFAGLLTLNGFGNPRLRSVTTNVVQAIYHMEIDHVLYNVTVTPKHIMVW